MDFSNIDIWLKDNLGDTTFILKVFLVVFITLLTSFIWRRLQKKLLSQLKKTDNAWDDALVVSLSSPLNLVIWAIGIWVIVTQLFAVNIHSTIKDIVLVVLMSWFLVRFVNQAENNIKNSNRQTDVERKIDHSTIEAISKLLRASISITTALVVLQTLGVSISAVLAFGGIAIGFAAKDLLANFFGGLIIYLDRPFSVGDWIRSADRQIEGTVEYIGWRQTRIRTFDSRPLYVPNAIFNSITVENPSRMQNRRIFENFGVRYDDVGSVKQIAVDIKQMLKEHDEIDENQTLIVNLNHFSESSVDIMVYTFTKTTNWIKFHEVKQEILLRIVELINNNDAEIAYPTQRLQLDTIEASIANSTESKDSGSENQSGKNKLPEKKG